jgi:hypothetical protein
MENTNFLGASFTLDVTAQENSFADLSDGKHLVKLSGICFLTDRHSDWKGGIKPDADIAKIPWKDATPQLAFTVRNDKGSKADRIPLRGFARWSELDEAQRNVTTAEGDTGYAVDNNGNRLISSGRTAECMKKLGRFLSACGSEAGVSFSSAEEITSFLKSQIEKGVELMVSIKNGEINSFWTPKNDVEITAETAAQADETF